MGHNRPLTSVSSPGPHCHISSLGTWGVLFNENCGCQELGAQSSLSGCLISKAISFRFRAVPLLVPWTVHNAQSFRKEQGLQQRQDLSLIFLFLSPLRSIAPFSYKFLHVCGRWQKHSGCLCIRLSSYLPPIGGLVSAQ